MPLTTSIQANSTSAFSPFAEYSIKGGTMNSRTTFPPSSMSSSSTTTMILSTPAPVELIHSSDSLQALPFGSASASAFRPIKQMSSTAAAAAHCSTPSMSSTSSLSSPSRSNTSASHQHQQPLRIPQPPRHTSTPSSSSLPSGSQQQQPQIITRFPPSSHHQRISTNIINNNNNNISSKVTTTIKPQIIGAGSGNASIAAVAALNATRSDLSSKTFNELVEIARRQQQQIDANRGELEERQKLISAAKMQSGIVPSIDQLKIIRQNIARDERELSQLSSVQRQTKALSLQNDERRKDLMGLQETYSQDEQHLRHAVEKVDSLKKQIELLYRRRASAASAAIAQQRQINAFSSSNNISASGVNGSMASSPNTSPQKNLSQSHQQQQLQQQAFLPPRPQASVVPFQIQKPMLNSSIDSEKITFDQLDHAPASGMKRLPQRNIVIKRPDKPPPPPKRNPGTVSQYNGQDLRLMNNGIERALPPPSYSSIANQTDYYKSFDQGALIHGRTDQLSLRNDSMKSLKRRSLLSQIDAPEADIFRLLLEEQRKGKTHISFNDIHPPPPLASKNLQNTMNVNGVTVNLRSNVQQPRPAPVLEESTVQTSQAAQMPIVASVKVSVSPQQSPLKDPVKEYVETSILTDPSIAELEKPVMFEKEIPKKEEPKVVIEAVTAVDSHSEEEEGREDEEALKRELENLLIRETPSPPKEEVFEDTPQHPTIIDIQIQPESPTDLDEEEGEGNEVDFDDEELLNSLHHVDQSESSSSSCLDEEGTSSLNEIPIILEESNPEEKAKLKGILRAPGKKKHNKRIVFDPFVLFLDGALEGQLDTVKENATKIDDVSKPNDEGITALHNAICACHYEIVKFLVDAGADVNALDSDGWSPLHCAASCNNLPMLKLLVQNGASIFATTLSDSETPIRKCEEKESGYDQCITYLSMCDAWAGIINDGKMFAFYAYSAENDDELSFQEGECLTVISRENHGEDRLWWLCESEETKKRGLIPANFLGLYPTQKHSHRHIVKRFEIPSTPPPTDSINNNSRIKTEEKMIEQSSNFEKSLEISANA